ncbi:hypothetical protein NHQ30_010622 [Ciborinia camelliae]|nr:hypothetical protein NHQ30_010622 [Ciborinia camelliae]
MSSNESRKRSISPSAEAQQNKRPRISLKSYKSIYSSSADDALPKTKTKPKPKIKIKLKSSPPTNKFIAINPQLPKSTKRDRDPLRRLESAEKNAISIRMRPKDTDEALSKSVPLTNQFIAINSLSPQSARNPRSIFGNAERKAIARWMQSNKAIGSRGKHAAAFQNLLSSLGCQDPSFDKETVSKFRNRLERFISRIKRALKECGAVSFHRDDKSETEPIFAEWTVVWLEKDWDGVYDTRRYYTDNFLEKYSPAIEAQQESEVAVIGLPVDEPFEEEVEIFVVEDPNEVKVTNVTNAGDGTVRDLEDNCNPYGMADSK